MPELSPEEKKKIYEEEKARLEAQEKLKKEQADKKKTKKTIGCLIFIILVVVAAFIIGNFMSSDSDETGTIPDLKAKATYNDWKINIINLDSYDWNNVKIELNKDYKIELGHIKTETLVSIDVVEFVKSDGTRFNPLTTKPVEIFIRADTPHGRGYYTGSWK